MCVYRKRSKFLAIGLRQRERKGGRWKRFFPYSSYVICFSCTLVSQTIYTRFRGSFFPCHENSPGESFTFRTENSHRLPVRGGSLSLTVCVRVCARASVCSNQFFVCEGISNRDEEAFCFCFFSPRSCRSDYVMYL